MKNKSNSTSDSGFRLMVLHFRVTQGPHVGNLVGGEQSCSLALGRGQQTRSQRSNVLYSDGVRGCERIGHVCSIPMDIISLSRH